MADVVFKKPGCCTRCEVAVDDAFMVQENHVVWKTMYADDGTPAVNLWQKEMVPVCQACVTPGEEARLTISSVCAGCGLRYKHDWRFQRRSCSERCEKRIRRARARARKPMVACTVCKASFRPKRTDAEFCSGKCRQWAYRRRQAV